MRIIKESEKWMSVIQQLTLIQWVILVTTREGILILSNLHSTGVDVDVKTLLGLCQYFLRSCICIPSVDNKLGAGVPVGKIFYIYFQFG